MTRKHLFLTLFGCGLPIAALAAVFLFMDLFDPLVQWMGPHINRRTVQNVRDSPWHLECVDDLGAGDIFKLIVACKAR